MKLRKVFIGSILVMAVLTVGAFCYTIFANQLPPLGLPSDTPINKVQAVQKQQQLISDGLNKPIGSKKFDPAKIKPIGPIKQGPTDILPADDGSVPAPSGLYRINNKWVGNIDNKLVQVFAGAKTQNLEQGVVIVFDGESLSHYNTSQSDGSLTITKVDGTVLTLNSVAGVTYTFDIGAKKLIRQ